MAPSFSTIIVFGILATRPVLAGSRAWESSIVYTPPSNAGELLGSITTNATNGTGLYTSPEPLKKRWVTINPGDANSDDHLWPDGKISYCYESTETKELFSKDLVEARILWEDSGLGAGFDWEEKDSSFCKSTANRPKFLLIVKSDGLSCTTGVPPLNKMNGDRGPLMRLSANLDIGKKNLVANFAHQMGHAWGLHHEHQNPAWWSSDYAAASGKIFSASNFKCENLADYASVSQKLTSEQLKKACTSRASAQAHHFSAAEYLPFTDSTTYRASDSMDEPDWESIMIYGTGDNSVLTKPNGVAIKHNLAPSQKDVAGLKKLYSVSPSSKFNPLGSKSNTQLNKFKDIRKKDKDSGCKEAEDDKDETPTTSATSSFVPTATATADCKAIGEGLVNELPAEPAQKRQIDDTLHSRRIEKRGKKDGIACPKADSWTMYSFGYPSAGQEGFVAQAYGWNTIHSCSNYEWGRAYYAVGQYDTEHILEWSVITNFFTTVNSKYSKDHFVDPDPNEGGNKISFCKYWKQSWAFAGAQWIDNPAPQAGLSTTSTVTKRWPIDWIAAAYPYRQLNSGGEDFVDELVLLQKLINTPAKNNMFSDNAILEDNKMQELIKRTRNGVLPQNSPRMAIQHVRTVVGVFKYMQEPVIAKIFKDEKVRMGAMIDGIDKVLPQTPRQILTKDRRTFAPWQTLGLGTMWDDYMDEVFKTAKDKGTSFVEDNIKLLKEEYTSQIAKDRAKVDPSKTPAEIAEWAQLRSDIDGYIVKLEAEWNNVKNWAKPW